MTVIDRGRADRITARARDIHVGQLLLAALGAALFAIGWAARKTVWGAALSLRVAGVVISWSVAWPIAAVRLGWREAHPASAPSLPTDTR